MDRSGTTNQIAEGSDVYGSDGEKVGSIAAVRPNYLVVEKGFFFPSDYYIPVASVAAVEEGRVHLAVTKDAALNQGWDAVPADYDSETVVTTTESVGSYSTDTTAVSAGGAYATGVAVGDAVGTTVGSSASLAGSGFDETLTAGTATDRTVGAGETISVPVREESLSATTTARELGEVRIEKDVVAEERTLSVPVTEERVRVERRVVDRPATEADAGAFRDEVIEVPVYGEDVQLQKSVRVAEEVEIGKEAVTREQQVTGTVRREEVRVVGDVVEGGTTGATGDVFSAQDVVDGGADQRRR
jgi:uncharacterized protein (TIGR02271 family)